MLQLDRLDHEDVTIAADGTPRVLAVDCALFCAAVGDRQTSAGRLPPYRVRTPGRQAVRRQGDPLVAAWVCSPSRSLAMNMAGVSITIQRSGVSALTLP